jgi:flagellar biosynthesis protein
MAVFALAVGLVEDPAGARAPEISVSARGAFADEVVKTAIRYGVPLVEDPALAQALGALDLDAEVPQELFEPVALILARLHRDGHLRKGIQRSR